LPVLTGIKKPGLASPGFFVFPSPEERVRERRLSTLGRSAGKTG